MIRVLKIPFDFHHRLHKTEFCFVSSNIYPECVSTYILRRWINTEFNVALESSEGFGVDTVGGGILQRAGAVVLIGAHRSLSLSLFTPFVPVLSLDSQTGRFKKNV